MGRSIARAISAVDIHLNQMDTRGFNRGSSDRISSALLISRVITVEIKHTENSSGASDRDLTTTVSMRFITRIDVASSRACDRDQTTTT